MSKLYKKYLELKSKQDFQPNTLFLFKSGLFFIFLDEDAKLVSTLLDLKLCPLNDTVMKCGFPATSLQKYLNLLNNTPYHVQFVVSADPKPLESNSYLYYEEIKMIMNEITSTDIDHLSISEIYDFLSKIQNKLRTLNNKESDFNEAKG